MKVTLDFRITSKDARQTAGALYKASEEELLDYQRDAALYAADLLVEIAGLLKEA